MKTLLCLTLALVMFAFDSTASLAQPAVFTDRPEYSPGDTVLVQGSGWGAAETVALNVYYYDVDSLRTSMTVLASESGELSNRDFIVTPADYGLSFSLVAEGLTTGSRAECIFADAAGPYLRSITYGGATPQIVNPGEVTTMLFTVKSDRNKSSGECNSLPTTLSVTSGLPEGVTWSFEPPVVYPGGSNCEATSVLTIITSPSTPMGSFQFTVFGQNDMNSATTVKPPSLVVSCNVDISGTVGACGGVPDVLITLYDGYGYSSVVSDPQGHYLFENQPCHDGEGTVTMTVPPGYSCSLPSCRSSLDISLNVSGVYDFALPIETSVVLSGTVNLSGLTEYPSLKALLRRTDGPQKWMVPVSGDGTFAFAPVSSNWDYRISIELPDELPPLDPENPLRPPSCVITDPLGGEWLLSNPCNDTNVSFTLGMEALVYGSALAEGVALSDVDVSLVDGSGTLHTARTRPLTPGSTFYYFYPLAGGTGTVGVTTPDGFSPVTPASGTTEVVLEGTQIVDFIFEKIHSIIGWLEVDCGTLPVGAIARLAGPADTLTSPVDEYGWFSVTGLRSGQTWQLSLQLPPGYVVTDPAGNTLDVTIPAGFDDPSPVRFGLTCVTEIDVTGTITSTCGGPLTGVSVDLDLDPSNPGGAFLTTATDTAGSYSFLSVRASVSPFELSIVVPLGYEPLDPVDGDSVLAGYQDHVVNVSVDCLDPTGSPRGKCYWKHQAKKNFTGRGSPRETFEDMSVNFPLAIFEHFHENQLNSIQVEGVTFMLDADGAQVPMDLEAIVLTLSKGLTDNDDGGFDDDDRDVDDDGDGCGPYLCPYSGHGSRGACGRWATARRHYLAMLLNMASGKLLNSTVISADGRTVSQALQEVSSLILDGTAGNDVRASRIARKVNQGRTVPAGDIGDWENIAYRRGPEGPEVDRPFRVSPNPGGRAPQVFSFEMPAAGNATLAVYDVSGRRVAVPLDGPVSSGSHNVTWSGLGVDGQRVPDGVYFVKLTTVQGEKKMMIVRLGR